MKIVVRHGVLFITLVSMVLVMGGLVLSHSAAFAQVDKSANHVEAQFGTSWIYDSPDEVFTNGQVTGRKWWDATVHNSPPDETRAPVSKLALTLESELAFNSLQREHLETSGPPTYRWSFGDVPEETSAGTWVDSLHGSDSVLVTFIPGFDASRSADRTEFTEPATQTLTITLTPREATEGFSVFVQAEESDLVDPVITSPASGEGVSLPPDGHLLHINPIGLELNATWTVAVTIQVTPKSSEVVFMPYVMISRESEAVAVGTKTGSSLSHSLGDPSDEAGTWTWSAEGTYQWAWEERLSRNVSWLPTSEPGEGAGWSATTGETGNVVRVGWLTRWIHYPNGDTFTNAEVPGAQWWTISDIQNLPDATGAPVKGLTVTLESDESFDYLDDEASEERPGPLTRRGPPVYEWSFPDLPEQLDPGVVYDTTVGFGQREQYMARPGFDVTRTFDQTVFTEPGTQTVTITVTPRELWVESVSIGVIAHQDEHYTSSVVSISGAPQAFVEPSGWAAGASDIPVQVDVPVTITAVVQVVPKNPPVEYKSMVNTGAEGPFEPGERAAGTVVGSALSYTYGPGTWTVRGEGEYVWQWQALGQARSHEVHMLHAQRQGEGVSVLPEVESQTGQNPEDVFNWPAFIAVAALVVIAGAACYLFIRKRLGRGTFSQD